MRREFAAVGHPGLCPSGQLYVFSVASLTQGSTQPLLPGGRWRYASLPLGKTITTQSVPAMMSVARAVAEGATCPAIFAGFGTLQARAPLPHHRGGLQTLPPVLKPGAPFCCLGPAFEGFLGCGYSLSRAAMFYSRLGGGDHLPFPGCESSTRSF